MRDPPPYQSDEENQAPRKPRQEEPRRSTRNSEPNAQIGCLQDNPHGSNKNHNDRTRNKQEKSQNRYRERDQYYEEGAQSGNHQNNSLNWYQEREKFYKEREKSRNQQKRSQNHYQDNDETYKEREQNRSHQEMSKKQYQGRGDYYKERTNKNHQERSQSEHRERDQRPENYMYNKYQEPYTVDIKEPQPYYKAQRTFAPDGSQLNELEYEEPEPDGGILDCHKCKYLCTGRACCQLVEVLLNMLILICCSVSYNSTGGFTGITNMGGIYYYQYGGAYSGFDGADGEKAQKLDVQFYQLKLPTVTASMAFGGALMGFCCLLVLLGVLRIPWRFPIWLLVEFVLDILIAVGYVPALYFYFRQLQEAYSSQICKDRESLYSSKGYKGFSCALHGADIAAGLFACMAIIAFFMSAALAIKGYKRVRSLKKKPVTMFEF